MRPCAYGGPSCRTNFGRPARRSRIRSYSPMSFQRASVSGSAAWRFAFMGKSVRGRFSVSFQLAMGDLCILVQLSAISYQPSVRKLGAESWELEAGSWELEAGSWKLGAGSWELEAGSWKLGAESQRCPKQKRPALPKERRPIRSASARDRLTGAPPRP